MDSDSIAVIGMSCRFPGGRDRTEFWRLLRDGRDALRERPADRPGLPWAGRLPAGVPWRGGFLEDIASFDAEFFGISPREAVMVDPQQRLTLELGWEALEDAGILPAALRDSPTGVFVGAIADDYAMLLGGLGPDACTSHTFMGGQRGMIANRLSYFLDLKGPSLVVDCAQSSALVAIHRACESVRSGECELAIAGGVNLAIRAEGTVALSRFGSLSPDQRCFTFDARANGYVRGEGGGLVVLKPLDRAVADGDRIYGVVLGGATNNDGRTISLPTPSPDAQRAVLGRALQAAGVQGRDVQYVELHGSGTAVGDPIEAAALAGVLGARRSGRPDLAVGSVKTNIGHLEGAAGVAGFIKTLLCVSERTLVPSLNFRSRSEQIDLAGGHLRVQVQRSGWPRPDERLIAGVSSFGMGGTNCHVIVADAPVVAVPAAQPPEAEAPPSGEHLFLVSARTPRAVAELAGRLREHVRDEEWTDLAGLSWGLGATRTTFAHRAAFVAADRGELIDELDALATAGAPPGSMVTRTHHGPSRGPVFVFPGQGSQWPGMAAALLRTAPAFAAAVEGCSEALAPHLGWSMLDLLTESDGAPPLHADDVVQPALWTVMVGLARLWESCGVRPAAVVGHSQGEIAAATVSGALPLADGARLVATRSRLLGRLQGKGGMAAIALGEQQLEADLTRWGIPLEIAAFNGPAASVVAGNVAALDELLARYKGRVRTRRVDVAYASHSTGVEAIRTELAAALAGLAARPGTTPFWSTVTGGALDGERLDAGYWFDNLRRPVRFAETISRLLDAGSPLFVEMSPHPLLVDSIASIAEASELEATACPTLRRGDGGYRRFLLALGQAAVAGADVSWSPPGGRPPPGRIELPHYPFQRRRYWPSQAVGPAESHAGLAPAPDLDAEPAPEPESAVGALARLADGPAQRGLAEIVRAHATAVLGGDPGEPPQARARFAGLGLDSAMLTELRRRLAAATGLTLPTGLLFDHPTSEALAAELLRRLRGDHDAGRRGDGDAQRHGEWSAPALRGRGYAPTEAAREPIAIIGMACRLPGGIRTPDDLWRVLVEKRETRSGFPTDRGWDLDRLIDPELSGPGTTYVDSGGFLYDAGEFDATLFGISPREAAAMDPQQRLLLEVAWEALERARVSPRGLRGSRTGVFAGAMPSDYGPGLALAESSAAGFALTGTTSSVISGRIAYVLGLEGPAMTIDTACSSSLVALHLAVRSLRAGECSLALAGGVNVMSTPGMFVEFARQRGLAPDGRCKSFGQAADGTAWAEGAGMLVLAPLAQAQRSGQRVLAVIEGTAINADGASGGLTAPSGRAQQRVIRDALADARVAPAQVAAVEAHGTGTALGDPIEAEALIAAYGRTGDGGDPLWLGSLKSNLGHAMAAAGVAGVIKMAQALQHETLPATLHADPSSPRVDWSGGNVRLLSSARPWPHSGQTRRAGVSSFGISGTNAHVVLAEAPDDPPAAERPPAQPRTVWPWLVHGAGPTALEAAAGAVLRRSEQAASDEHPAIARSLALTRSALDFRAAVVGADPAEVREGLRAVAESRDDPHAYRDIAIEGATAFLFPGSGSQRVAMGTEIAGREPVFAAALDEAARELDRWLPRPIREVIRDSQSGDLDRMLFIQPAVFALEVSLYRQFEHWGLKPDYLLGHSVGEFAAAHVAGVLSLPDACRLVTARSTLMDRLPAAGAMVAISAAEAEVLPYLVPLADRVSLAAINGRHSTVISGDEDAVMSVAHALSGQGHRTKRLPVSHASHSPLVEPLLAELAEVAARMRYGEPSIPVISTVTGAAIDPDRLCSPEYWANQVRATVRYLDALLAAHQAGARTFLELGPSPVLCGLAADCIDDPATAFIPALRPGRSEERTVVAAAARAHVRGVPVDWSKFFGPGPVVDLPVYPFQRERYWTPLRDPRRADAPAETISGLIGRRVDIAQLGHTVFSATVSLEAQPWLADHVVGDEVLFPGTGFLELALAAGAAVDRPRIDELTLVAPLRLPASGEVEVQVLFEPASGSIRISSRPAGPEQPWTAHALGGLSAAAAAPVVALVPDWPPDGPAVALEPMYEALEAGGYRYGRAFRALRRAWRVGSDFHCEVASERAGSYTLDPMLMDALLHPMVEAAAQPPGARLLPFEWRGVSVHHSGAPAGRAVVRCAPDGRVGIDIRDESGTPIATIDEVVLRSADEKRDGAGRDLLRLEWTAAAAALAEPESADAPGCAVLGRGDLALASDMTDVRLLSGPDELRESMPPVVFAGLSGIADPAPDAVRTAVGRALALVGRWLAEPRCVDSKLVFVTRRAIATGPGDEVRDHAGSAVWGLIRAAQTEHPGRFALIDLDERGTIDRAATSLIEAGKGQLAIRVGAPLVPVLVPSHEQREGVLALPAGAGTGWRLAVTERGTLANVRATPHPRAALEPGQVRIDVHAAGVNFRDVMGALGLYPGDPGALGLEGAGVVTEVGADVGDLRPGDRVMGLFSGAFGPEAMADRRCLVPIPPGWTFAQAASVPVAFLTAWHGLVELAKLRPGESVLVHAAAGGVGMAAVQVARAVGARVFATASPDKWSAVTALGVEPWRIASSRTSEFAARFATAAAGGIDVVLNSLTGELLDASLALLAPGARFIELGKSDVRDAAEVHARHEGALYRAFDLLTDIGPEQIQRMLTALVERFASGELSLPPRRCWDVRHARAAFAHVANARHVGKVVLTLPPRLREGGTTVITGGTGGLGRVIARHLVTEHGVRHLVLASRRGADAPGARELRDELATLGAEVSLARCDVADPDAVRALLESVPAEHPLTAIVHAAGVLDDATITATTAEQLDAVLRAKVDGAIVLHELTAASPPDLFVSFSSVMGTMGGAGQAGYAAANHYLDALAHRQRAAGRHGLSLPWGPWAQPTGMTSALSAADRARMARSGLVALDNVQACALFDAALMSPDAVSYPVRFDAEALARLGDQLPGLLRRLAPSRRSAGRGAAGREAGTAPADSPSGRLALAPAPLSEGLAAEDPEQARRWLFQLVATNAAVVLGQADAGSIRPQLPFKSLGFDSLTSVELRNRLSAETGVRLPSTLLFDYPTPAALVSMLEEQLVGRPRPAPEPDPDGQDLSELVELGSTDELPELIDDDFAA
jgi:acyl transferase domain-containing protein/NADPH:quinone reductase-like Zn-dependent oxidoreductase/NADP-dependent 3-hydroxy acid dehydrogenase YdfG/acyl carrier protein